MIVYVLQLTHDYPTQTKKYWQRAAFYTTDRFDPMTPKWGSRHNLERFMRRNRIGGVQIEAIDLEEAEG